MKKVEIIKANRTLSDRNRLNMKSLLRVAAYCRVSTDSDDQLNSYNSQVSYYTDLIKKNNEWSFVDIYADEGITGTQISKRTNFQRLINDCMNGEIDMVITKSISRFARNTLDTLRYVRMLKEKNIAVYFEDEKINTLTMDGELLLVVLSSVAQQEVENISANVKKGLKMKMSRGELVGFQGCLGYDYNVENKSITINREEAEIVRYIFNRYIEGAGGRLIGNELEQLGYKTKRGSSKWHESTILGIIKNEKYKGDVLLGKTFTLDPISKRRLENYGEEDQFYLREHHEPIVSEEIFDKAQAIRLKRSIPRGSHETEGFKRQKYSRKYAFSCMIECAFCGGTFTRRCWHSGTNHSKVVWQCVVSTKRGKKYCEHSKGIPEKVFEDAFVESYRQLCGNNKEVLEEFLSRLSDTLNESNVEKRFLDVEKQIEALDKKRKKLIDMRLEDIIDKESYEEKYYDLTFEIKKLSKEKQTIKASLINEKNIKERLKEFRKTLERNEVLEEFDRYVFESIVDKVIVGATNEDGTVDPYKITFVYKTGFDDKQDGNKFINKNLLESYSKDNNDNKNQCSHTKNETCRKCS